MNFGPILLFERPLQFYIKNLKDSVEEDKETSLEEKKQNCNKSKKNEFKVTFNDTPVYMTFK